jgi:hypothetical protein
VIGGCVCPPRQSNNRTIHLLNKWDANDILNPASGKEIVQQKVSLLLLSRVTDVPNFCIRQNLSVRRTVAQEIIETNQDGGMSQFWCEKSVTLASHARLYTSWGGWLIANPMEANASNSSTVIVGGAMRISSYRW